MDKLLFAFCVIFPAYVANAVPVLFKGTHPMDFGKTLGRKPILGKGKTWEGFIGGVGAGVLIGIIMQAIHPSFGGGCQILLVITSLSMGAVLGDVVESFLKRRLGRAQGEQWLVADQIDFLIGAFLLCLLFNKAWFTDNFTTPRILLLVIVTPLIHIATNICAYALKLKKVPW